MKETNRYAAAVVPLHTWRSEDFNPDGAAKEGEPRFSISRVWEHHVAEMGIHPLADNQTCGCPARHIPETSKPYQIPSPAEESKE